VAGGSHYPPDGGIGGYNYPHEREREREREREEVGSQSVRAIRVLYNLIKQTC
jgi:hypothetical protein